jgi:sugar/nucleoside kinase (ribokinase family)
MKDNNIQIICCGHAAWDMNFMMDEFPAEDQKYKVENLIQSGGGPAANAASLLAKWEVGTAYAGLLGDDIHGRLIVEELKTWGVNTELVQLDPAKDTPISTVIVNTESGSRTLLNRRNPSDQPAVKSEAVNKLRTFNPSVLHFDGHALDLSEKMMELYPEAVTVMDAGSLREATSKLSKKVDYVICSRRYAEDLTGIKDFSKAGNMHKCLNRMKKLYKGTIVVTRGGEGLFYEAEGKVISMKAFRVNAVDSTAAGDIFHAAFSYGLLHSWEFEYNLHFASAAAAVSVGREGGKPSIPTLKEVEELYNSV